MPDVDDDELSEHITSRREVERILGDTPAIVVVLRAAVLLGSQSPLLGGGAPEVYAECDDRARIAATEHVTTAP